MGTDTLYRDMTTLAFPTNKTAVAIGAGDVLGVVALVITTLIVPDGRFSRVGVVLPRIVLAMSSSQPRCGPVLGREDRPPGTVFEPILRLPAHAIVVECSATEATEPWKAEILRFGDRTAGTLVSDRRPCRLYRPLR